MNWIRLNRRSRTLRQRFDQQGLGEPGDARNHGMPADNKRDHDLLYHAILRNDDFAQLLQYLPVPQMKFVHKRPIINDCLLHIFHPQNSPFLYLYRNMNSPTRPKTR